MIIHEYIRVVSKALGDQPFTKEKVRLLLPSTVCERPLGKVEHSLSLPIRVT